MNSPDISREDLEAAFSVIDSPQASDDEAGALINAAARSPLSGEAVPLLAASLRSTRSPSRAILIIRALRGLDAAAGSIPELLHIARGTDWDPGRDAWWVALGTLSRLARREPGLAGKLRALAEDPRLTEHQASWAAKCADRAGAAS
ncbi:hypothetical protein J0910_24610 [Nocardiopsis sp. CNT-189]|uniref:hypothetical protein n=1 Tax=Nocardiopsis oceanisediminis TaxID=2816862 RepID=UPI003B30DC9C